MTARQAELLCCHSCHLLSRAPAGPVLGRPLCPRCGAVLHARKPFSLTRTWALVLAAVICYLPANLMPMTISTQFGAQRSDTIMSGVLYFMTSGDWFVAGVIFVASIVIPLLKIVVLMFLLLSIQFKSAWRPEERTRLYRITETVGRWSMVDIFVVTIVVALVRMQLIASIDAGPAAFYFCAVVVITMLAANAFDPRLIWDAREESFGRSIKEQAGFWGRIKQMRRGR